MERNAIKTSFTLKIFSNVNLSASLDYVSLLHRKCTFSFTYRKHATVKVRTPPYLFPVNMGFEISSVAKIIFYCRNVIIVTHWIRYMFPFRFPSVLFNCSKLLCHKTYTVFHFERKRIVLFVSVLIPTCCLESRTDMKLI